MVVDTEILLGRAIGHDGAEDDVVLLVNGDEGWFAKVIVGVDFGSVCHDYHEIIGDADARDGGGGCCDCEWVELQAIGLGMVMTDQGEISADVLDGDGSGVVSE